MAHLNIDLRRFAVECALERYGKIDKAQRRDLAREFQCSESAINADIAHFIHKETPGTYHVARGKKRAVARRDNYTCQYCLTPNPKKSAIDHITPFYQGGKATMDNLVFACSSCNVKLKGMTGDQKRELLRRQGAQ